ncbi:hypothetical protein E4U41_004845, partial [Claviceps citrina]
MDKWPGSTGPPQQEEEEEDEDEEEEEEEEQERRCLSSASALAASRMPPTMPAVMDDPARPSIHRVSGQPPFPGPNSPGGLPADIIPRQVTLRDRQTVATIVPFGSRRQLPVSLLAYLCDQLNREIEGGDTYPMMDAFTTDGFADYWFQTFAAVMLLGEVDSTADHDAVAVLGEKDWARECLGSFFIKPNYPGRSSHVCNGSFITTDASRNRGVGRLMGEAYIDWAPRLGYTYSVFNLVYETNVASCRIWDALGFKRIGRIKGCGNLRSHPDRLIDAIIYGRDLAPGGSGPAGGEGEELVSEERFDKIRFYLKYGRYPNGADRAEKSRLRSAATHYKLLEGDKLMLKDKEVISDPGRQYEIARSVHALHHHGGINKTTATIAERYHWSRIKETVSDVIRACAKCKDQGKTPSHGGGRKTTAAAALANAALLDLQQRQSLRRDATAAQRVLALQQSSARIISAQPCPGDPGESPSDDPTTSVYQPIDPLIISHQHHQHHHQHHHHHQPVAQQDDDAPFDHYHPHPDFQALLHATEDVPSPDPDAVAAAEAA